MAPYIFLMFIPYFTRIKQDYETDGINMRKIWYKHEKKIGHHFFCTCSKALKSKMATMIQKWQKFNIMIDIYVTVISFSASVS